MSRFNPFPRVSGRYGAPMGRRGDDPAGFPPGARLYVCHCGGDGFYDRGGAYWGHARVFAVWTHKGARCAYVEASSKLEALRVVEEARK